MKNWVSKPWDPGVWDPENHRPSRFFASRTAELFAILHGCPGWSLGSATDAYHELYGYGSIPINSIFRGMNIHLPAILMWTTGVQGFDTLPYEFTWSVTWMIYPHEPYSGYSGLLKRAIFLPNRWEICRVIQIEMCLFAGYLWVSSKIISAKEAPDQARSASAKGEGWACPTWGEPW